MTQDDLDDFLRQIKATTDELREFKDAVEIIGSLSGKMENLNRATRDRDRAERDNTTATARGTAAVKENAAITEALTDSFESLEKASNIFKTTISGLTSTAVRFGDALLSVQPGMAKYGQSINKLGDTALELGAKFGPLGTVIGGIVKVATFAIDQQLKQADLQVKAIQDMSKIGGAGAFTAKEILQLAAKTGVTMERFDELLKPMQSLGTSLVALGVGAADGQREFIKLAEVGQKTRMEFFRLGVTFPELIQNMADYVNLQRMSGRHLSQELRDSGKLREETLKYTLQLQQLSELTGMSVEESKKGLETTTNTIEMAAISLKRQTEIEELERRKKDATGDERAAIERRITLLNQQEQSMKDANIAITAITGGSEAAGAAMQKFLQYGSMDNEFARMFHILGMDLTKYSDKFQQTGQFDEIEFFQEYINRLKNVTPAVIDAIGMGGKEVGEALGAGQRTLQLLAANRTENLVQIFEKMVARQKAATEAVHDSLMDNAATMAENERAAQLLKQAGIDAMQVLYDHAVPDLSKAFNKLTDHMQTFMTVLGKVAQAMGALAAVTMTATVAKGIGGLFGGAGGAAGGLGGLLGGAAGGKLAKTLFGLLPGVGSLYSAWNMMGNISEGNYGSAGLDAVAMLAGLLPGGSAGVAGIKLAAQGALGLGSYAMRGSAATDGEGKVGGGSDGTSAGRGKREKTDGLILHHTGGSDLQSAISTLQSRGFGYHYLIDRNGSITSYVPEDQIALHAGVTDKQPGISNRNSIGISLVAKSDSDITKEQLQAGMSLGQSLISKYGITSIYGHGETSSHKDRLEGHTLAEALRSGKIPELADGGITKGPKSGYPAVLHGNEMVIPLDPKSILAELGKNPLERFADFVFGSPTKNSSNASSREILDLNHRMMMLNQNLMQTLNDKLDTMIRKLDDSNDIQQKMLKYARA